MICLVLLLGQAMTHVYVTQSMCFVTYFRVKTIPLQAWTGPEVSRRLRLPDFKTVGK